MIEPHNWRWVRYCRRPARSVPPKIEQSDLSKLLVEAFRASLDQAEPTRAGVRPPSDPNTDNWTWQKWDALAHHNGAAPGWAFCRFANRTGSENVAFVFGLVRGSYGVWEQPFNICLDGESRKETLTCITHLRSGIGCGIFAERVVAIEAAELAERVCPPSDDIEIANFHRMRTAWEAAGIRPASNSHCHDAAGNIYELIGRSDESILDGKPERLS